MEAPASLSADRLPQRRGRCPGWGPPSCPALQCERCDPPLRKVPIFSRGMKSFLIPAQNGSLRVPAREGAFGQRPKSLMGRAAGAGWGRLALPGRGVAAGLGSSPAMPAGSTQRDSHLSFGPAPLLPHKCTAAPGAMAMPIRDEQT